MVGLFTAAISCVSSACSAIGSALSVAGSGVMAAGSVVMSALQTSLPIFHRVIQAVSAVAQLYDLICKKEPEKDVMDLGMRADIADSQGIHSEQFENYQSYIDHLRNEIKADKIELDRLKMGISTF